MTMRVLLFSCFIWSAIMATCPVASFSFAPPLRRNAAVAPSGFITDEPSLSPRTHHPVVRTPDDVRPRGEATAGARAPLSAIKKKRKFSDMTREEKDAAKATNEKLLKLKGAAFVLAVAAYAFVSYAQ